jgi:hypothetical protein
LNIKRPSTTLLQRRLSVPAEPEGMGVVEVIATLASIILLVATLPFSLCFAFKVSIHFIAFLSILTQFHYFTSNLINPLLAILFLI